MPPESTQDESRPAESTHSVAGLEHLLLTTMKSSRLSSRTRPAASAAMERSMLSMENSFMLDHWASQSQSQSQSQTLDTGADLEASSSNDTDKLTPISNWAHLSYMKNQRNTLRAELKAHQIAGAEAKQSVASLRRLAFRMAVNISVKEKQIATSARNLVRSRKDHYLEGKDAQKRIDELKRALSVEEGRNKEILEALERASMLTLQCMWIGRGS
jgi:hypothetical protein